MSMEEFLTEIKEASAETQKRRAALEQKQKEKKHGKR